MKRFNMRRALVVFGLATAVGAAGAALMPAGSGTAFAFGDGHVDCEAPHAEKFMVYAHRDADHRGDITNFGVKLEYWLAGENSSHTADFLAPGTLPAGNEWSGKMEIQGVVVKATLWISGTSPDGTVASDATADTGVDTTLAEQSTSDNSVKGKSFPLPVSGSEDCKAEVTTTTTTAQTTTTEAATTTTIAETTTTGAETTTTIAETTTTGAETTTTVTATTHGPTTTDGSSTNTLPATGANNAPLVGAGFGFLVLGSLAMFTARRRRPALS